MSPFPVITELDAERIRKLGNRLPDGGRGMTALDALLDVADAAEIVPGNSVPADVVTVNSTVSFRDRQSGAVHRVTVVYPAEFSVADRRISVLSPVGRALLGRRVGEWIALDMPDGSVREIQVLALHYQPEAAGDFTR
ncbi:MAG TPA: nucleoside diphosphate kinase regulator [Usitatibacter sp.]|nr:nucleoside diphosphate kinase regulator [Usitatibacter sp.]